MDWNKIRYFTKAECGGDMNEEFMVRLDTARVRCGFPWKVTSGLRTASANIATGGAPKSKHLTGEAVDIACTDSAKRYAIVAAAIQAGIKGIEVCDRHVHLDNRDRPTLWSDKSR